MGFYDCRCMITGVSLKGADAALVLLQQSGDGYAPLALPIKGSYNRLGSIDLIDEDANTDLVLQFFQQTLQVGRFTVAEDYLRQCECFPIETIEQLLQGFERNMNDHGRCSVLNGQPVVFALIARAVWETIAQRTPTSGEPALARLQRLFQRMPVGMEIYAGSLEAVSEHLEELVVVDAFLASRELAWQPGEAAGQDYSEEMRQYLRDARQTFADSATILEGLKTYEDEVGELLSGE